MPSEYIHEEFQIGSIRFDVIAIPPVDLKGPKTIGIEWGNKGDSWEKSHDHFKSALNFVDFIVWIPYNIYKAPYSDLINARVEDIDYLPGSANLMDQKYSDIQNSALENRIAFLVITKVGRFPETEIIRQRL